MMTDMVQELQSVHKIMTCFPPLVSSACNKYVLAFVNNFVMLRYTIDSEQKSFYFLTNPNTAMVRKTH